MKFLIMQFIISSFQSFRHKNVLIFYLIKIYILLVEIVYIVRLISFCYI